MKERLEKEKENQEQQKDNILPINDIHIITKTNSVPTTTIPLVSSITHSISSSPPNAQIPDTSISSLSSFIKPSSVPPPRTQSSTTVSSSLISSVIPTPQKPARGYYISGKSPKGTIGTNSTEPPQRPVSRPVAHSARPSSFIQQVLNDTPPSSSPQQQQQPIQQIQTTMKQKKIASATPQPQSQNQSAQKSPNQLSISSLLNG